MRPAPGLSPRVRGSRLVRKAADFYYGIIPACAGKPRPPAAAAPPPRDYPRVCGEAFDEVAAGRRWTGLSPRVRGSRFSGHGLSLLQGIIPACAGKPAAASRAARIAGDYPRVCGEARYPLNIGGEGDGLSPRVRGSQGATYFGAGNIGIIPACAGKPLGMGQVSRQRGDYPRVCGEARRGYRAQGGRYGLSPRVRGSPAAPAAAGARHRIIPACAGKPTFHPRPGQRPWDYPRVCGEAKIAGTGRALREGLSPRVRGSRRKQTPCAATPGIIPACAGKPVTCSGRNRPIKDYPRVCGEAPC